MRKNRDQLPTTSRRTFIASTLAAPIGLLARPSFKALAASPTGVASPDGKLHFELLWRAGSQLGYRILFNNKAVIESSLLGILVNNVNLGYDVELGKAEPYRVNEKYPWRGIHSEAINRASGVKIALVHKPSKAPFTLEVRAFNNGVAFRYMVPGEGARLADEATGFVLPA
jgi:alpha-glucosidase